MRNILLVLFATSACIAQNLAGDIPDRRTSSARPSLTNPDLYNSHDLAHSPLGVFEKDSNRLTLKADYRHLGWTDVSKTGHNSDILKAPSLRIGQPQTAFFEIAYGPQFFSSRHLDNDLFLTQHRFAITLAGQTPSALFQAGLSGYGTIGTQTWGQDNHNRVKLGLDLLRIDLGSQIHPLLRIGFYAGVSARIDTLADPAETHQDRYFQTELPSYGSYADFGSARMPIRSNLSLHSSSNRFVYVSKGIPPQRPNGNENAIIYDSSLFTWQTMGQFHIDQYQFSPAVLIGWGKTSAQMYTPHEENDPVKLGPAHEGENYSISHLNLGIGASMEAMSYATFFTDYLYKSLSLECGEAFATPQISNRTLHSLNIGIKSPLNRHLSIPLELIPRIGYFITGTVRFKDNARFATTPFSLTEGKSQQWRYQPETMLGSFERISGFVFGAEGSAINAKLFYDIHLAFLNRTSDDQSGFGFGSELTFVIPDKK
ncbi:MAG: hypothetical protein ACLFQB_14070 [Chitinispirillaceae bacterium]